MDPADQASSAQTWQRLEDPELKATIYQRGAHHQGNFIRVYVPEAAKHPGEKLRVMLYLHGFALCLPSFYEDHLRELTRNGWIVIFPDFQPSAYREEPLRVGATTPAKPDRSLRWGASTRRLLGREGSGLLEAEDLPEELAGLVGAGENEPGRVLPPLKVGHLRRVLLPWLLIQLVLAVIGWFRRNFARNLGQLIGTVLISLAYAPTSWLANALFQAERALSDLSQEPAYAHWAQAEIESNCFGHSLGGLLALSLPSLGDRPSGQNSPTSATAEANQPGRESQTAQAQPSSSGGQSQERPFNLQPQVIVTADPATSTEMGIPGFAICLLKLFHSPFTTDPVAIQETGAHLLCPVAILHGLADTLVPPQLWAVAGGGGAFSAIASPHKALYFDSSNPNPQRDLIAFHNQAVTSTQYYDDDLFKSFGGVKHGPNAYNCRWIWPALLALCGDRILPEELLQNLHEERPFEVSTDPPKQRSWF